MNDRSHIAIFALITVTAGLLCIATFYEFSSRFYSGVEGLRVQVLGESDSSFLQFVEIGVSSKSAGVVLNFDPKDSCSSLANPIRTIALPAEYSVRHWNDNASVEIHEKGDLLHHSFTVDCAENSIIDRNNLTISGPLLKRAHGFLDFDITFVDAGLQDNQSLQLVVYFDPDLSDVSGYSKSGGSSGVNRGNLGSGGIGHFWHADNQRFPEQDKHFAFRAFDRTAAVASSNELFLFGVALGVLSSFFANGLFSVLTKVMSRRTVERSEPAP